MPLRLLIFLGLFVFLELHHPLQRLLLPQRSPEIYFLLPRVLAPNQAQGFNFQILHAPFNHQIECEVELTDSTKTAQSRPCQWSNPNQGRVDLPALPPGRYQVKIRGKSQNRDFDLGPYFVQVRSQNEIQLETQQSYYYPGSTLQFSVQIHSPIPAPNQVYVLEVKRGKLIYLRRHIQVNSWGYAALALPTPEDWPPGSYQLRVLSGQQPLATRHFMLLSEKPQRLQASQHFQIQFQHGQLIAQLPQTLPVSIHSADGQPMPQGWLRIQDQTYPIKQGQAEVQVTPSADSHSLSYTVGTQSGELYQGVFRYTLLPQGLIAYPELQLKPAGQAQLNWQIRSDKPRKISYTLGQNFKIFQQGELELKTGDNQLLWSLSPQANPNQAFWLSLLLPENKQAYHYHWQPSPFSALPTDLELRPNFPTALDALVLKSKAPTPPFFSEVRQSIPVALSPVSEPLPLLAHYLEVISQGLFQENPWYLPAWSLFYGFIALGLGSLLLSAVQRQWRQATHPLPPSLNPTLTGLFGLSLLGLFLTLFIYPLNPQLAQPLLYSLLGLQGLTLGVLLWQLRQSTLFPLLLLGLSQGAILWAFYVYQPSLRAAFWLWSALGWWLLLWQVHRQNGGKLNQSQTFLLSSLVIFALGSPFLTPAQDAPSPNTNPMATHRIQFKSQDQPHITYSLQSQVGLPQQVPPLYHSGFRRLDLRLISPEGKLRHFRQTLLNQPTVIPEIRVPDFALQGDRLFLPLKFTNENSQPQTLSYRLNQMALQTLMLNPFEEKIQTWPLNFPRAGNQTLTLTQDIQGRRYQRQATLYIKAPETERSHPQLTLNLEIPHHQNLELGEELPVIVKFKHRFPQAQALGLQIGLPTGYQALSDNLKDSHHQKWLASVQVKPGYLNLLTHSLAPQQEISFHFRLKVELAGRLQMPASAIFSLAKPDERRVRVESKVFSTR